MEWIHYVTITVYGLFFLRIIISWLFGDLDIDADADAKTKVGMIPAEVVKAMIYAGMTPEMIVQYMTVDHIEGIAEAQAKAYEHIHLGNVSVYGSENTAAQFMTSIAQSVMPMIQTAGPIKEALGGLFKKKEDTHQIESK